jgi:hypothetical protein
MSCFFFITLFCLVFEVSTQGQKKGFRGGDRSYGIKVEASAIGTNLQYKLPEAKAKSSSPTDWQVDNDNAEMLFAMNSPILANVITKNPKFSVKGQWPGYETTLTLPKDVKTGSKKNELTGLDGIQGSGSVSDATVRNEDSPSGSGTIKVGTENDSSESGSGSFEGLGNKDLENTVSSSSGFGSAEGGSESRIETESKLLKAESTAQKQEQRSNIARNTQAQQASDIFKDLSLEKVKLAVENLKHFNLKDPRTSKALKDIIIHAKQVVQEAKTVLSDVASVVTSVRDFVTGNYDFEEEDDTRKTVSNRGNDLENSAKNAREEAENAARQADFAARRAQAASEMARKFANEIWSSAKTSGTLGKSRNAFTVKQKENEKITVNESFKKHEKLGFSNKQKDTENSHVKTMDDFLTNIEQAPSYKFFWNNGHNNYKNLKVTEVQHHHSNQNEEVKYNRGNQGVMKVKYNHGNQSVKNLKHNHGNPKIVNGSHNHSNLRFVVVKHKDGGKNVMEIKHNHSNHIIPAVKVVGNKKSIRTNKKKATGIENAKIKMKSYDNKKDKSQDKIFGTMNEENTKMQQGKKLVDFKNYKLTKEVEEKKRIEADKTHADNREALSAAKVSISGERQGVKGKHGDNHNPMKVKNDTVKGKKHSVKTFSKATDTTNNKNNGLTQLETLVKERLQKIQIIQSKSEDNHEAKVLPPAKRKNMALSKALPWQHRLPEDANEVVKNTEAHSALKASVTARPVGKTGRKEEGKTIASVLGGSGDVDDDDDDDGDSGQSGSTISGSYEIELELEPEKLEFVKGEGKLNEKRIRINDLTANGGKSKVPPSTLKEILKAIKRVEGILGFTIEKTKTTQNKSHANH